MFFPFKRNNKKKFQTARRLEVHLDYVHAGCTLCVLTKFYPMPPFFGAFSIVAMPRHHMYLGGKVPKDTWTGGFGGCNVQYLPTVMTQVPVNF